MPGMLANPRIRYGALAVALPALLYALLQNPYWAASGDAEVYMSAARNMASGAGYTFNGEPVVHYPPAWPLFLATILRVTSSFAVFTAIAKLLLLAAALVYYLLLLRMTSPRRAFLCVFVSATLWWWFSNAYFLYSESIFLLLTALALLLAHQVASGRDEWWRMGAVAALCACLVSVRWLGVLTTAAVAATVLSGELWPRLNKRWLCMALCVAAAFGTFALLYGSNVGLEKNDHIVWSTVRLPIDSGEPVAARLANLVNAGTWLADILWPPVKKLAWNAALLTASSAAGWLLWPFIFAFTISQARRKQWMLAGILLYIVVLICRWALPEGRYLLPFIPVLLLALWNGVDLVADWLTREYSFRASRWKRPVLAAVFGSVLLCNLALYAIDMAVMRSRNFYSVYLAGEYQPLLDIAQYIRRNVPPGEVISINSSYDNMGKHEYNRVGVAATALLTDRIMEPSPDKVGVHGPSTLLVEWAQKRRIRYFVFRAPISPWRLWHFRVPGLQRRFTGEMDIPTNPFWQLYIIENGRAREVRDIPPAPPLTHLPPTGWERCDGGV